MSTTTTNFSLVKPSLTDAADITAMNPNWDLIDGKLYKAQTFVPIELTPSDTNMDNITTAGIYKAPTSTVATGLTNSPTTVAFTLLVENHTSTGVKQTVTEYYTASPKMWFRNKHNTTWGNWFRIYNSSDVDILTSSKTIYVSTTGNDTTGTGESGTPYKTINKALSTIPKNLNGKQVVINIAAGTYNEAVNVDDFYGGVIQLGVASRTVTIASLRLRRCSNIQSYISNISHMSNTFGMLLQVDVKSNFKQMNNLTITGASSFTYSGIGVSDDSNFSCETYTVTLNNLRSSAVWVYNNAKAYFYNLAGSNNTDYGLRASEGGIISYNSSSIGSTYGNSTSSGGRILTSSGTSLSSASIE